MYLVPVMSNRKSEPTHLLRRREVEARTGVSRTTIYEWVRTGHFPRPIAIGARSLRWREQDIERWISAREAGSATGDDV